LVRITSLQNKEAALNLESKNCDNSKQFHFMSQDAANTV